MSAELSRLGRRLLSAPPEARSVTLRLGLVEGLVRKTDKLLPFRRGERLGLDPRELRLR